MAAAVAEAQCLVMGSSRFPAQAVLRTAEEQGNTNTNHVIHDSPIHHHVIVENEQYRVQTAD
jgi:hypothetical protein